MCIVPPSGARVIEQTTQGLTCSDSTCMLLAGGAGTGLDKSGEFLKIVGRLKELIVKENGKKVTST